jgi:hypothetical protein
MRTDNTKTLRNGKIVGSKAGDKVIGGYKNATKNRRKYKNTRKYI